MKLWMRIFIGMALGVATGMIFGEKAADLKIFGTIFLRLINMIIPLLILGSMITGVTSIHDPQKLGRVGGKTILIYMVATFIAISLGISLANGFDLGSSLSLTPSGTTETKSLSLTEVLISFVPNNPIAAMVEGNIIQIIVFAIFVGMAINFAGSRGRPLQEFFDSLADVMYRVTSIVMEFSPIGVFGIMAWVSGTFGLELLLPLLKFLCVYFLACFIQFTAVYVTILRGFAKLGLRQFLRGMSDAAMMAFSTCSSAATLPVAMHCVQENLGVSKNISSFVFPLGITMNMNGTAIFQSMSAVFIATAYGISLDWHSYLVLVFTSILSAIGTAGVPGSGFVMISVILTALGLPMEGLALLAGIDRIREMVSTVLNIMGDAVVTVWIAKQEGELDEKRYYHTTLVEFEEST